MKKTGNLELARVINQQAHMLAAHSFDIIRMSLQDKARELLKAGRSLEETLQAIRAAGRHQEGAEL